MKKQLHTEGIANELKGSSLFFTRPNSPPTSPPPAEEPRSETPPVLPNARTPERPLDRPAERVNESSPSPKPRRRQARRYSFEIFEDQIERIKRIALEDQLRGGELNQSAIARKALDRYLPELEAELAES